MKRRSAALFIAALVSIFGAAACGGGEGQVVDEAVEQQVEILEERVDALEVRVAEELAEEPQPEQTQPQEVQEDTN